MRSVSILAVAGALALATGVAAAAPQMRPISPDGEAPIGGFVADRAPDGRLFARQVLPATTGTETVAISKTLYLNHAGVTLNPGNNSSFDQTSTIITERVNIAAWDTDQWADVMSCMQDIWSRFDVTVTDVDPGSSVPHIEAVFAGAPADLGLDAGIAGVSPFTSDCAIIDNSIVFAFTANLPDDPREICEVTSQELAHSYGLDHELLASDPMTYLDYTGDREFQDATVSCGEFTARPCGINGSTCRANQDSVQLLTDRVGLAGAPATGSSASDGDGGGDGEITGGCDAGRGVSSAWSIGLGLVLAAALRRRR